MFWLRRKKLMGSYLFFKATRQAMTGGRTRLGNIFGNNDAYNCLFLPITANQNPLKPLLVNVLWMFDT